VSIIGSSFFGAGVVLVFASVFTFLVDSYPTYAASALAANSFTRKMFAAGFLLFGNAMYSKLGYQWATFYGYSDGCHGAISIYFLQVWEGDSQEESVCRDEVGAG